ncbi:SCY1-like protein 2 [Varroa destructor]|uniref:Protein kinase domain-containing protein n=1 Tax=Varroa destructor TaxID=109461 RepID=A0A7M7J8X4_VARDE|nr:SCY1-like protein 2 [Varroa destructor]XP_022648490.1 SCY1-like protein 2 [Varroa destructor]XP_022648491.1 SCY1-like protein 2 [Varroa destructor]XP_022648492.1 SCY1-like protein 2 [Varroa destructor]XP_022648493.1 SCY1-like protein 2 [Varroa destructor]XP_022648494.1 SCY1-like protein 2 [Varroa destructor]XP_022648495.1 SCY1-like protein 2 [Varroa destructor]
MDYLSRIKSTVVDTVSNLSSVLTGNPLSGQYEMGAYLGSYGPCLLWKMFQATKRSTREEACVFLLEKKSLDRYPKAEREFALTMLKRGVAGLTRLRHPAILTVSHPLEESRESLAFATEACFCSLANIVATERPASPNVEIPEAVREYKLHEVEIKYGLAQVSEALAFLHQAKLVHGNVCPESIVINKKGAWKLAGFEQCKTLTEETARYSFDSTSPTATLPNYEYIAPECALQEMCWPASDMYSLGVLVYAVHMNGITPYSTRGSFETLKTCLEQMKNFPKAKLQTLPQGAREYVKLLLSFNPQLRPDAHQFGKLPYLEDVGVKTLRDLDSLYQLDKVAKSHIYKGLPPIVEKLPKRINLYRVLPCIAGEYVNAEMVPFVLPTVLIIAEMSSPEEFGSSVLPELQKVFLYTQPVHIMYLLLQKMDLLISRCPPEAVRDHLLSMVYRALECNAQQIQELCLNTIPNFAQLVEYGSMKNHLLPRIKKLCISTSLTSTRVGCLVCMGKILEHLDKWVVLDDIIAWLPEVKSRDSAVLMAILGVYKISLTHQKLGITKEILACKVIPFLVPLSIEGSLNLTQFNQVIALVKEMISQVEVEHRTKLEQTDTLVAEKAPVKTVKSPSADELMSELTVSVTTVKPPENGLKNLSLEEKQRLARQEESMRLFEGQAPLASRIDGRPARLGAQKLTTTPKDLTTSLLNSNLMNLENKTNNLKHNLQDQQQPFQTPNYNIDTSSLMSPTSPSNVYRWGTQNSLSNLNQNLASDWSVAQSAVTNAPSGGGWEESWGDWSTSTTGASKGVKNANVDLSEFDTLMSFDNRGPKKDILKRNRN